METMLAASAILSPVGLVIFLLLPSIAVGLARRPGLSAGRLIAGYLGALCALVFLVAAMSYVSPGDSATIWHVPPDRYWGALVELFIGMYVVAAFATVVGISCVGIPVLVRLAGMGRATAPWLIICATAISAGVATVLYGLMQWSSNITFIGTVSLLVTTHVISATGFALAARLPWRLRVVVNVP